jgi:nicotinamide-nucleotide amidase
MVQDQILPRLRQLIPPSVIRTRWYRVAGIGESDLDSLIAPIYTQFTNPVTTILAAPGDVHIHFRARTDDDAEAERLLAAVADPIVALLGDRIYSSDGATLEQTVGRLLLAQNATLATAESITAGLLGGRITDTSGSSAYYAGGFQTYTDAMKTKLLGVDPALLAAHTAVSEPVALAMAQAARERTGANYALSLTGYAEGDQAGLCFAGLATPQHVHCRQLKLFGDRHRVRSLAVIQALDWLRKTLLNR